MNIIVDRRVDKFVETLSDLDQSRISGYLKLFRDHGFILPSKYLKKIDKNLWELRPGDIRILFGKAGSKIVFVNVFKKKTQKTPRKETETAKNRLKEY